MSKKSSSPFELGSAASAMYHAQRKDITGTMAFSLSFVGTGIFVVILGVARYFVIHNNMTDLSENYNAWAWLVIAASGLIVALIGVINILQSMVSLGEIGSVAKNAESHASPFQNQKLNRKVTAMNQSQSLQTPGMEGMAEKSGMSLLKKKTAKDSSKKDNEESKSSKLYDKYNPSKVANPPKSAPMTEQKFDYGIEESKKLTFADEFLMKNKKDPFAQYRKDLGIAEEAPTQTQQPKPQFIPSSQQVTSPEDTQTNTQMFHQKEISNEHINEPTIGLDLDIPDIPAQSDTESMFTYNAQTDNNQPQTAEEIFEEPAEEQITQTNTTAPVYDPYGQHREEDDGMFFTARPTASNVRQTTQQQVCPTAPSVSAQSNSSAGFTTDTTFSRQNVQNVNSSTNGGYNFSLFEEIDPLNSKKYRSSATTSTQTKAPVTQQQAPSQQITAPVLQKQAPQTKFPAQTQNPVDYSEVLGFTNMFSEDSSSSEDTLGFESPFAKASSDVDPLMHEPELFSENIPENTQDSLSYAKDGQSIDYNLEAFEEKPTSQTENPPQQNTGTEPQSFSSMFLNRQKVASAQNTSANSHEICTNGTRSQRKYVAASEYDEWSCPNCGKVNQEYVGVCACGRRKPRVK